MTNKVEMTELEGWHDAVLLGVTFPQEGEWDVILHFDKVNCWKRCSKNDDKKLGKAYILEYGDAKIKIKLNYDIGVKEFNHENFKMNISPYRSNMIFGIDLFVRKDGIKTLQESFGKFSAIYEEYEIEESEHLPGDK